MHAYFGMPEDRRHLKYSIQCLNKSHQSMNIPFPSVTNNNTRKHYHMFANNMIFKLMRIAIANKNGTIHGFDKLNIFNFSVIDPWIWCIYVSIMIKAWFKKCPSICMSMMETGLEMLSLSFLFHNTECLHIVNIAEDNLTHR